jgi:uncharacterized protein (DUF3084 family)
VENFLLVIKDDEVETIDKVKVKRTVSGVIREDVITLKEIDHQIQVAKGQIKVLQAEVERLILLRDAVKVEAEKVKLKKKETVE